MNGLFFAVVVLLVVYMGWRVEESKEETR